MHCITPNSGYHTCYFQNKVYWNIWAWKIKKHELPNYLSHLSINSEAKITPRYTGINCNLTTLGIHTGGKFPNAASVGVTRCRVHLWCQASGRTGGYHPHSNGNESHICVHFAPGMAIIWWTREDQNTSIFQRFDCYSENDWVIRDSFFSWKWQLWNVYYSSEHSELDWDSLKQCQEQHV